MNVAIPPALYAVRIKTARAIADLLLVAHEQGLEDADAISVVLATVAQVLCAGLAPEHDQDLAQAFTDAIALARMSDNGNLDLVDTPTAGAA
jgi:hypothetical protein